MSDVMIFKEYNVSDVLSIITDQINDKKVEVFSNSLAYLISSQTSSFPMMEYFEKPFLNSLEQLATLYVEASYLSDNGPDRMEFMLDAISLDQNVEVKRSFSLFSKIQVYGDNGSIGVEGFEVSYMRNDEEMERFETFLDSMKQIYLSLSSQ